MENSELQRSSETARMLSEQDLRQGILISIAIQGSVERSEDVYGVLPSDLRRAADLYVVRPNVNVGDTRRALEDYLDEDEIVSKWVVRDEAGSYILSPAGIAEMSVIYEGLAENPVAWHALDTVIQATAPDVVY